MPRIEDFVEFNQLFGELVHLVTASSREVTIQGCVFAFDLVGHPHEGESEIAVEAGLAFTAVL